MYEPAEIRGVTNILPVPVFPYRLVSSYTYYSGFNLRPLL